MITHRVVAWAAVLRSWIAPAAPPVARPIAKRRGWTELGIVFAITLGLSGIRSLLDLINALLASKPLNQQHTVLNAPATKLSTLDLFFQLAGVLQLLAWGALAVYLLAEGGIRPRAIGLDADRRGKDAAAGIGLTALIGIPGLALYFGARAIGADVNVAPTTLGETWWRVPVLILSAFGNAWAEETLVTGYLLTRLRQLGCRENRSLGLAAVLRGSYHLYQGFGGFVGNALMGLIFGRVWQRTNRLVPLILAHTLLDVISFVGYALLVGRVSWL
jgi:membrane protease YdiL (CAAX protease family)